MIDRVALHLLQPPLKALALRLTAAGVAADTITWMGFAVSVAGAGAISQRAYLGGLALLMLGRLADGLDGEVARLRGPTDRGAFLDITLDFIVYALVPLAFAWADPAANALAAAVLLAAFFSSGGSFLALAVMAERRGLRNDAYPQKGLYFLGGLAEGGETIICFVLMALWPQAFAWWAYGFAALCALTGAARIAMACRLLAQAR
ncbi:MAG: CDP-alcohol phosphatidyltransferase family protein [Aquabacterium sp.]